MTIEVGLVWGRFQPPHIAHQAMFSRMYSMFGVNLAIAVSAATKYGDPLTWEQRKHYISQQNIKYQSLILDKDSSKSIFSAVTAVYNKYAPSNEKPVKLTLAGDQLRLNQLIPALVKYNGVSAKHGFYKFQQISSTVTPRTSEYITDHEKEIMINTIDPANISGTLVRSMVKQRNFRAFATLVGANNISSPWVAQLYQDMMQNESK